MDYVISLINMLGFNVELNDSTPNILLFACVVFVFAMMALLCFVNIMLYFFAIYITEHKLFLDWISKYSLLLKIVNFYNKTRMAYLLFEIVLFLANLGGILYLTLFIIIKLT